MNIPSVSFLILDFSKHLETLRCINSIRKNALFPYKLIYLDNGACGEEYPNQFYNKGFVDVLIRKRKGMGGGYGQTDLIRYCDTEYFFFVQNDQELIQNITNDTIEYFIDLLNNGYHCIDLNGDQSRKGIWTDRAHFMKTSFFNELGPFPNGGPGLDSVKWNEQYLQEKFKENDYKIFHMNPLFFLDNGRTSIREAGDGLYKHNCDNKKLWILKQPTYITEPYPPFDKEIEWPKVLKGEWIQGDIPINWEKHSFRYWND